MRSLSDGERAILAQNGHDPEPECWRILNSRRLKARTSHECDQCHGTCATQHIRPGELYHQMVVIDNECTFKVMRFCWGRGRSQTEEKG